MTRDEKRYLGLGVIGGCGTTAGGLRSLWQGDVAPALFLALLAAVFWVQTAFVYRKFQRRDRDT